MTKTKINKLVAIIVTIIIIISFWMYIPKIKANAYQSAYPIPNLTGNQREDIVNVAMSQKGYKKDGGTIYGAWYDSIKGTNFTNAAWCAMFVSWCANQSKISQDVLIYRSYVPDMVNDFKNKGQWHDRNYTPSRGDIIIVNSSGHVGIVTGVSGSTVYTIEGNKTSLGSACGTDSYKIGSSYITGYGSPNYNDTPILPDYELSIDYPRPSGNPYLSTGSTGSGVSWLQTALNKANNAGLAVDGDFGSGTKQAVINFQKSYNLEADGIAGVNTINKLVEVIKGQTTQNNDEELGISYPRPSGNPYLSTGSTGSDVSWLQTALNKANNAGLTVDGDFGSGTKQAVINFQNVQNLEVDGIAGVNTINKLVEVIKGQMNPKPSWAWISATDDRTSFAVGEEIHFWMSADETSTSITHYTIGINKGDERIITEDCNGDYYISFNEPGDYSVYVSAYNNAGWADSNVIYFKIYDNLSKPTITTNKETYNINDTVEISWNPSSEKSNLSHYWLVIKDPDGIEIVGETMGKNTSHSFTVNKTGEYTIIAYATPLGSNSGEGSLTDIKIINVSKSIIQGDINADGEFTVSDIVTLQKWLLQDKETKLADWQAADINEDGMLNIFDLCLMKQMLINR